MHKTDSFIQLRVSQMSYQLYKKAVKTMQISSMLPEKQLLTALGYLSSQILVVSERQTSSLSVRETINLTT